MSQQQIDIGEQCYQCHAFISSWRPPGHRQRCLSCEALDEPEECDHSCRLRCPKCKNTWDVWDGEHSGIFEDGCHNVTCSSCLHEFEITTSISFEFTSPAIGDLGDEEGGESC